MRKDQRFVFVFPDSLFYKFDLFYGGPGLEDANDRLLLSVLDIFIQLSLHNFQHFSFLIEKSMPN
jgi:hypothetical protein